MWGFQRTFRSAVERALQKSLEVLGVTVEPTVFLIGLLKEGGYSPSVVRGARGRADRPRRL